MNDRLRWICGYTCVLGLFGCSGGDGALETSENGAPMVPTDGTQAAVAGEGASVAGARAVSELPGEWMHVASYDVVQDEVVLDTPATVELVDDGADMANEAEEGARDLMAMSVETGDLFRVRPDFEKIEALLAHRVEPAEDLATAIDPSVGVEQPEVLLDKGWSDGVDNREAKPLSGYPVNHKYSAVGIIGTANGFCTATLVGTWYALTAAHCVVKSDGTLSGGTFAPRQEGGYLPYSFFNITWGVWDAGFTDGNCHGKSSISTECVSHDIALVQLAPPSNPQYSLSLLTRMRWGHWSKSSLTGADAKRNLGYPGCKAGRPSSLVCSPSWSPMLYGDGGITLGSFKYSAGDGEYRYARHSGDTSPGHSGGPVFFSGTDRIFGVESTQSCSGSACTSSRPNSTRLIDAYWSGVMSYWM